MRSSITPSERSALDANQDVAVGVAVRTEEADLEAEAFEHFPYGMLVADRDGRMLMANPEARELLGLTGDAENSALACCDLFGCRRPGGPFAHGCVCSLAAEAGPRLEEVRVDLPGHGGSSAVWVTVSSTGSCIVFGLRAGHRGDRRRQTSPQREVGPVLRIFALGRLRVEGHIGGKWLNQRTGQLLKLLITERHRVVPADEIAQALWPDAGAAGLDNLRYFVHATRDKLEPARRHRMPSSFIVAQEGGYTLNTEHLDIDVDRFERHARAGERAFAEGERVVATARLEEALALYRGEFLADEPFAEWVLVERDHLRAIAADSLRMLADIRLAEHDLAGARVHVHRLAEIDKFDTDVQRRLIALCLRTGRRSEAVRRYTTLRKRMLSVFGEVPNFELSDLAKEDVEALQRPGFTDSLPSPPT